MFKPYCPKCQSTRITVQRDAANCWYGSKFVFHCDACGKVLYGDPVLALMEQQEKAYQAGVMDAMTPPAPKLQRTPADIHPKSWTREALEVYDLGVLRSYASKALNLVGASKIPGGKPVLIGKMLDIAASMD